MSLVEAWGVALGANRFKFTLTLMSKFTLEFLSDIINVEMW